MTVKKWIRKNTRSLAGKTVAISGSTGGLGIALCRHLSDLGASLILLDRNGKKAQDLIEELKQSHPKLSAQHISLDLSDIHSVKAVTEYLCKCPPDYLLLNAGIYHVPRFECACGYNNIFQVNFLSPYYMAKKLKPVMQKNGGKIIATGSIAHNYSHIDTSDIDFSAREKSSLVYGNSKRYLMYALHGLYKGESGLEIAHPGITFTNITSHYPKVIFAIIKHPMKIIFMRTKKASLGTLQAMLSNGGYNTWFGPRVLDIWGFPSKKPLKTASADEIKIICEIAEEAFEKMEKI